MSALSTDDANVYAISSIGWGKGFTQDEAIEQYVKMQLSAYPAKQTVFKTRKAFEEDLRNGSLKPQLFNAPEGTTGFVLDGPTGLHWRIGDNLEPAKEEERIT